MEPNVIILASGILPFGSIFIEMYFIFTSFWAYKVKKIKIIILKFQSSS
jgi:transmembrane 9 superfamily protein 3